MIVELQILSLIIFISIFAAATVRVVRRGAKSYERDAHLPLEKDQ